MNALENCNFASGIFVDLQKAFDTADHEILLKKMKFYGTRGIHNLWFYSYLTNKKQYIPSINGFDLNVSSTTGGVTRKSLLWQLLFLIHINDLYIAVRQ